VYDGNTTGHTQHCWCKLVGRVSGDTVTLDSSNYTAIFAKIKYVANGIDLTVSDCLGGAQASDIRSPSPIGLTASIHSQDTYGYS